MDVTAIPFNHFLGLEAGPQESDTLVSLPGLAKYTNHLGTVHASALLAVAEVGSGAFLLCRLGDAAGFVPVVRRLEAKFRRRASGRVSARATATDEEVARWASDLAGRGRVTARVPVEVVDAASTVVLSATVEWFIARGNTEAEPS